MKQKVEREIYENCSESFLTFVEAKLRSFKSKDSVSCLLLFDSENTSFLDGIENTEGVPGKIHSIAFSKMFFRTSMLIELMKANKSTLSSKGKTIGTLQTFIDFAQEKGDDGIIQNLATAATPEELNYELQKGDKRKSIIIFLRDVKNETFQRNINHFIKQKPSSTPYDMRILSNNELCTYETTLGDTISPTSDFIQKTPLTEDEVATKINIKEYVNRPKKKL